MGKLVALRPVLYQGRMYEEGETLPAYDTRMVEAWLEAGSAEMDPPENTNATTGEQPMVEGYLDPNQLERMTKAELTDIAEKLGVDISEAKNNAERATLISAVTVQTTANENGGAL